MERKELRNMNKKENKNDFDCKYALDQTNRWIESADVKTGIALSLISITFSIYAGFLLDSHIFTEVCKNKTPLICLTMASFLMFAISIYFYIRTIIPRLTKIEGTNPFYYGDVSMYKNPDEFYKKFICMNNDEQKKKIFESHFHNSKIAIKKMNNFKLGLIFTAAFYVFSIASIIASLFS